MAAPQNLAQFSIEATSLGFQLHIESEGGDVLDLIATQEQLDLLADALDDALTEELNQSEAVEGA